MQSRIYKKILYVLELIYDSKELDINDNNILVVYDSRVERLMSYYEFENILKKLSYEILIINYDEFLNLKRPIGQNTFIISEVYNCFNEYYKDFKNKGLVSERFLDEDDKKVQLPKEDKNEIQVSDKDIDNEVAFELKYDEWYFQITINGQLLKKPQYNSVNRVIFEYLLSHPNKNIGIKMLKEIVKANLDQDLDKPLKKVAYELGFIGDRKKAFFVTSKNSAKLRTKVTNKDIKDLKIDPSKILPEE